LNGNRKFILSEWKTISTEMPMRARNHTIN
jgi:hypothetical protein